MENPARTTVVTNESEDRTVMPNFVIHGLTLYPERTATIRAGLFTEVARVYPDLVRKKEMVVQSAIDTVHSWDGQELQEAPYIEIRSTASPNIPTLNELAAAIKPFCDTEGLDIELLEITGFIPKNEPPTE
ncbi:MAG: hypothetical protein NT039_03110 [Candidatus Berkelbacteria bacterium]|nr:hypothetical protein [Candidatus Berkelbacteria bacterium]